MNPYVFFVGCSRSGTTLLRRIGDAHPELAIVREQHWLPRYWELRVGIAPDGTVLPELLDLLLADRRFPAFELPFTAVADLVHDSPPKQYAQFVTELFDLHGQVKGKMVVGEKTPKYVRHLPTLSELWPKARFVHMVRDGRDVALSLLDWEKAERNVGRFPTWAEDRVTTAALYWEWAVRQGREAAALLGPARYHELSYEELVREPELACTKLCEFLALRYDDAMLRFHEGRQKSKPGLSAKKAWQPVTAGLRDWSDEMSPADLARFEAATGELLDELGYPRGGPSPSSEELATADRLREAFAADARSRRLPVPRAWQRVAA